MQLTYVAHSCVGVPVGACGYCWHASGESASGGSNAVAASSGAEQQLAPLGGGGSSSSRGSPSPHHKRPSSTHSSRRSLQADDGASGSDSDSGAGGGWCFVKPALQQKRKRVQCTMCSCVDAFSSLLKCLICCAINAMANGSQQDDRGAM